MSQRPSVVWNRSCGELRQLAGAEQDVVADQERRAHLEVAVLVGLQVEHQGGERPLEPRHLPGQRDEAGAGELGGAAEIHAERGADLIVLLGREVEPAGLAPAPQLDVGALIGAVRHVVGERVGEERQLGLERVGARAHEVLVELDLALELGDLGDHRVGAAAPGAQAPDLARERVAARLALLQPGLQRPDRGVLLEQGRRHGRQAAAPEGPVERVRLFTQPSQIEHVSSHVAMASACK